MTAPSVDVEAATFGAVADGPAAPADLIQRDRWGRPILPTPDGPRVGHTRASSAGKPLEDVTKLTEWKERQVTVGTLQALLAETQAKLAALGNVDDDPADMTELAQQQRAEREVAIGMYAAMAKGIMLRLDEIGPEPDKDLVEDHKAWKVAVNAIVAQAHEAAGSKDRADLGTYLHSVFDARFKGEDVPPIPDRFAARYTTAMRERDVAATDAATAGWIELCRERFVVCDTWTIAGTLDSLVLIPIDVVIERTAALVGKTKASRMWAKNKTRILAWLNRRLENYAAWKSEGVQWVMLVGDLKSGRTMDFGGLAYTAQVAAYADAVLFDPETEQRTPYTTLLPAGIDPATVRIDTEASIIVHTPVGQGICRILDVPLDEGRATLAMASDVREMRNSARNWLQLVDQVEIPRPAEEIAPERVGDAAALVNVVGWDPVGYASGTPTQDVDATLVAEPAPVDKISDQIAACRSIEELLTLRTKELTPVDYGKPGPDGVHLPRPVVHWTEIHEALAGAKAALLKGRPEEARAALLATQAPEPAINPAEAELLRRIAVVDNLDDLGVLWHGFQDFWTPACEAAATARAEQLKPKAPEQIATEADPVHAEIARATSIPILRGVYAVHKDHWTAEYDAAAAARAEAIRQEKAAQQVA